MVRIEETDGPVEARIAKCDKHGEYTENGTYYPFLKKTIFSSCPECERELEEEKLREEREQERVLEISRYRAMNVEPEFYGATFDSFAATTKELQHNRDKIQELVDGKIQKVVMTGKNGTGKTHLACAALHVLEGIIMNMYEISATIRASYMQNSKESEMEIVNRLASVPLLVIDEIGRTKGSETEANWLSYIIDKRHVRGIPLILISNKHVAKACEKGGCPDCLENYIGEDIMSRLVENGVLLKFTGADWRRTKPMTEKE